MIHHYLVAKLHSRRKLIKSKCKFLNFLSRDLKRQTQMSYVIFVYLFKGGLFQKVHYGSFKAIDK